MRARSLVGVSLVMLLSACAVDASDSTEDPASEVDGLKECAAGATVEGIDVSSWQGTINWSKVAASGKHFAIARVSDGTQYHDSHFSENWHGIKSAGMIRGAYQFFRPGQDPVAQANLLISSINAAGGLKDGDLPPTLDMEVTDGVSHATLLAHAKTWLDHVKAAFGRTPMIYTSPGFWAQFGSPSQFSSDILWVAHWETACPTLASSWKHWTFWQHADNGSVPGISGHVDMDKFNGSLADLKKFAKAPASSGGGSSGGSSSGGSGLASLGGHITSDPMPGANADGRLEIFARGKDGDLVTTFQTAPNGGWSGWYSLGGKIAGNPAVVMNKDGRLEVIARGADHSIWHAWQGGDNGKFGGWTELAADVESDPTAARNSDGRLEAFVAGGDGWMYHAWQKTAGGSWSNWGVLGSYIGTGLEDPRPVVRKSGEIAVFARSKKDRSILVIEQKSGGGWTDWHSLGGTVTDPPAAGRNHDGRLEVFGQGTDGALWHQWETTVKGSWSGWHALGGNASDPVVTNDSDGTLLVLARGSDDVLYLIDQTSPGGGWDPWADMKGKMEGSAGVFANKDGRLEAFVRAPDGSVGHVWESKASAW